MANGKPQDCYLKNIKSENAGTASVSGWLKRRTDAKRADAFPESKSENPIEKVAGTNDARRKR
jgi:hypothetical protein